MVDLDGPINEKRAIKQHSSLRSLLGGKLDETKT